MQSNAYEPIVHNKITYHHMSYIDTALQQAESILVWNETTAVV